jgi:hypothetical protein
MRFVLSTLTMILSIVASATSSKTVIAQADGFFRWLDQHESQFLQCGVQKKGETYTLCDGTEVPRKDLADLFKLEPEPLVEEMQRRGIKVEILCDADTASAKTFAAHCLTTSTRKLFQEMSALHGQYLPEEKTILLRSSSLKGSLIHEYVHHLQSQSKNSVYGKVYKREKNEVRRRLTLEMDRLIPIIEAENKAGKNAQVAADLKSFMAVSEKMQSFAPWQDLIDEREIFLLFIDFGGEFGVTADDIALAKKNMGFVCKNPKWQGRLPEKECR